VSRAGRIIEALLLGAAVLSALVFAFGVMATFIAVAHMGLQ